MTREALIKKLEDIEWEDFEVKEAYSEIPKNVWETVSAFSNTSGGWIILGIRQNGKKYEIKGVKNPEKLEQDFTNTLRGEKFNVKILPKCFKYDFDEGTVLAFYISLSDKKPVYFNTQSNTFIRTASGDQRATKEEIDALYRDQAFGTQSSKVAPDTSVEQIHTSSLQQYRQYLSRNNPAHIYNRLTDEEFLTKLRLVSEGQLTYSGLLFLGTNDAIQATFPDFRIDYLEIPGTSYTNASVRYTFRIDEQENLWQYFFALFDRLRKQLELPFQLTADGFASEDYPHLGALREALINLLMHTDYFSPGKARIRVFQDRLEFFNPGALPESLERIMAEDLSLPRNPILAKLFRVARLAENAGYGFDKMIQGWRSYTTTAPEFEQGLNFTKVTFWLKEAKITDGPEVVEEDWVQVRRKLEKKFGEKFGGSSEKILQMIAKDPSQSAKAMSEKLELSSRAVEKQLSKLKDIGVIERIGPAKGGFWKINL